MKPQEREEISNVVKTNNQSPPESPDSATLCFHSSILTVFLLSLLILSSTIPRFVNVSCKSDPCVTCSLRIPTPDKSRQYNASPRSTVEYQSREQMVGKSCQSRY